MYHPDLKIVNDPPPCRRQFSQYLSPPILSVAKELSEIKISDFTSLFDPRFFFDPRFLLYLPSKSPNKD